MRLSGWALTGWIALALLAASAAFLVGAGTDVEGVRLWLRVTARTGVTLFLLAYVARPLRAVWRSDASAWLLRNRRYLGVAFAFSHALHGIAILWLSFGFRDTFQAQVDAATLALGTLGYGFLAAMALTSTDRTARWLSRRRWKQLHLTGMWLTWLIFLATFGGALAEGVRASYALPVAALIAAAGLRFAAWQRGRTAQPSSSAA